jgi:antitoxin YefM
LAAKERRAMPRIAFTEFQADPAAHLDRLGADRTMLIVTRPDHEPVAILPLSELKGLRETLHLLSSPVNGERLLRSITELDAGQGDERTIFS